MFEGKVTGAPIGEVEDLPRQHPSSSVTLGEDEHSVGTGQSCEMQGWR
jgi:hypothetical protein